MTHVLYRVALLSAVGAAFDATLEYRVRHGTLVSRRDAQRAMARRRSAPSPAAHGGSRSRCASVGRPKSRRRAARRPTPVLLEISPARQSLEHVPTDLRDAGARPSACRRPPRPLGGGARVAAAPRRHRSTAAAADLVDDAATLAWDAGAPRRARPRSSRVWWRGRDAEDASERAAARHGRARPLGVRRGQGRRRAGRGARVRRRGRGSRGAPPPRGEPIGLSSARAASRAHGGASGAPPPPANADLARALVAARALLTRGRVRPRRPRPAAPAPARRSAAAPR